MPKIVLFCQSLRSDWNHGNAHFLRGVLSECWHRGFDILALEPANSWSAQNLLEDHGPAALDAWRESYPALPLAIYDPARLDLDRELKDADLVLVHEWNAPTLVARIAAHRKSSTSYLLLFHDTHHRVVSAPADMAAMHLDGFDGVLAFGEVLREAYAGRAGHSRFSLGTRPRTFESFVRSWGSRGNAISCGSAIGATTSEPRSCRNFWLNRSRRSAFRHACTAYAIHLTRGRRWPKRARNSPATCRTFGSPMRSPPLPQPSIYRDGHMFGCCPGSRQYAFSRLWPAVFRWPARRGTTPRSYLRPAKTF